jgi:hypothetical protein
MSVRVDHGYKGYPQYTKDVQVGPALFEVLARLCLAQAGGAGPPYNCWGGPAMVANSCQSTVIRSVSPKGAVRAESVTHSTG